MLLPAEYQHNQSPSVCRIPSRIRLLVQVRVRVGVVALTVRGPGGVAGLGRGGREGQADQVREGVCRCKVGEGQAGGGAQLEEPAEVLLLSPGTETRAGEAEVVPRGGLEGARRLVEWTAVQSREVGELESRPLRCSARGNEEAEATGVVACEPAGAVRDLQNTGA